MSPTLQGRFLTTGQTGKSLHEYLVLIMIIHTHKDLQCWSLSRVRLFETPWIVACKPLLPMGFSRQEYWSGLPFPSPGDLPDLGVEPWSPALQADSLPTKLSGNVNYISIKQLKYNGKIKRVADKQTLTQLIIGRPNL